MTDIRQLLAEVTEGSTTPNEALREICRLKAETVSQLWNEYPGRNMEGIATFQTRTGRLVPIGALAHEVDEDGLSMIEVWMGPQQGPPAFRIVNPPMLVEDPAGQITATEGTSTRRYRIDPLQAIAEAVSG